MPAKILGDYPRAEIRRKIAAEAKAWVSTTESYTIPPGVSAETTDVLAYALKQPHVVDEEMLDLQLQHDGGPDALDDHFHPMPKDHPDPNDWRDVQSRLLVHVNLVRAAVRRLRSAVYGGTPRRTIVKNPYEKELTRFIGRRYPALMRAWFENKVLFGTGVAVPVLNSKGQLDLWLPYPPNTYLYVDANHVREYVGLVEYSADGDMVRFVTRDAMGILYRNVEPVVVGPGRPVPKDALSVIQVTNFGFFPGVVGYGQDCRHRGSPYGVSLVRSAVKGAVRATDCLFNASLLQKKQTRALMYAKDTTAEDAARAIDEAPRNGGVVALGKDGVIGFAQPDSKIIDTMEVYKGVVFSVSLDVGVAVDDLGAVAGVDQSAEAARRRSIPLTSMTQEQTEASVLDEDDLVLRGTGMLRWQDNVRQSLSNPATRIPVDLDKLAEEVSTEIVLDPTVFPESNNEKVANATALNASGAMTDEDYAWQFNGKKDKKQIGEIAAEVKRRRDLKEQQGTPGLGAAQEPLKMAASAQNT